MPGVFRLSCTLRGKRRSRRLSRFVKVQCITIPVPVFQVDDCQGALPYLWPGVPVKVQCITIPLAWCPCQGALPYLWPGVPVKVHYHTFSLTSLSFSSKHHALRMQKVELDLILYYIKANPSAACGCGGTGLRPIPYKYRTIFLCFRTTSSCLTTCTILYGICME